MFAEDEEVEEEGGSKHDRWVQGGSLKTCTRSINKSLIVKTREMAYL